MYKVIHVCEFVKEILKSLIIQIKAMSTVLWYAADYFYTTQNGFVEEILVCHSKKAAPMWPLFHTWVPLHAKQDFGISKHGKSNKSS